MFIFRFIGVEVLFARLFKYGVQYLLPFSLLIKSNFKSWANGTVFVKIQLNRYRVVGGNSPSINQPQWR